MPVFRFRSIEEMPPPWRDADHPSNLQRVAQMMGIHRHLTGKRVNDARPVQRFRTPDEANAMYSDPYRRSSCESQSP